MDKFEYIYYDLINHIYTYEDETERATSDTVRNRKWVKASLAELGQKGWEIAMPNIVGATTTNLNGCYLKRKIEEPSPSVDLQAISDESYKILTKAAYTGMLMAYDMLEKMGRLPHQQLKQQSPTKKQDIDHSYDR